MMKRVLLGLGLAVLWMPAYAAQDMVNQVNVNFNGAGAAVLSKEGAVVGGETELDGTVLADALNGDITLKLGAEYAEGDILELDFTGASLDSANSVPSVTVTGVTNGTMTLGLLSVDANKVVYRVTKLEYTNNVGSTVDARVKVTGLVFDTDTILASGKATVSYVAKTNKGLPLDSSSSNSATLFTVAEQFVLVPAESTYFNARIDVTDSRKTFVGKSVTDSAEVTAYSGYDVIANQPLNMTQLAAPQDVEFTLYGDFSFLGEAGTDGKITTTKVTVTGATPAVYPDRIVVKGLATDVLHSGKSTITINVSDDSGVAAAEALKAQNFTASLNIGYKTSDNRQGSYLLLNNAAWGGWKYNGASVHVPYMPFRDGYSPVVNVSNTSTQDGDIEVLVYASADKWVKPVSYSLPIKAKAQSQTNITQALKDLGISGDVAFDIIVAAPQANIAVNALYYNNGDRAVIHTVAAKDLDD